MYIICVCEERDADTTATHMYTSGWRRLRKDDDGGGIRYTGEAGRGRCRYNLGRAGIVNYACAIVRRISGADERRRNADIRMGICERGVLRVRDEAARLSVNCPRLYMFGLIHAGFLLIFYFYFFFFVLVRGDLFVGIRGFCSF